MRTVIAVIAFAFAAGVGYAQPLAAPIPPPAPIPPSQVVGDPAPLPNGKDVSQPLQPVGPESKPKPAEPNPLPPIDVKEEPEAKVVPPEKCVGPLGPGWDALELLYWWPQRQPLPALSRSPGGSVLLGGKAIDSQPSAGGRFALGWSTNTEETTGFEVVYFFLGTRSFRQNVRSFAGGTAPEFGLPYTNAATGANEVLTLARPGFADAHLTAFTAVRVQGWEVNSVANVVNEKCLKLNALIGWRYFQVHEGVRLEQIQYRYDGRGAVRTADQFDAHNRFHGGQLGLQADVRRGVVFCEMTAKIAFGQNYEVVKNEGMTVFQPGGLNGPASSIFGGSGLYVQPGSAGRTANGVFAVMPEGTFKFGFRLGDAGRVYVGYSFLYLSDAVRPGDQIDRTLNPAQAPLVSGAVPVFSDRPSRIVQRTDFWAQGLVIGLETRY